MHASMHNAMYDDRRLRGIQYHSTTTEHAWSMQQQL